MFASVKRVYQNNVRANCNNCRMSQWTERHFLQVIMLGIIFISVYTKCNIKVRRKGEKNMFHLSYVPSGVFSGLIFTLEVRFDQVTFVLLLEYVSLCVGVVYQH